MNEQNINTTVVGKKNKYRNDKGIYFHPLLARIGKHWE